MQSKTIYDFANRSICGLLRNPENMRELLCDVIPEQASGFDPSRMKPAPAEFLLGNWRRRVPDIMYEIPYRSAEGEQPALVCVQIEHQSKSDWQVPLKSFQYASLYWEWQWRAWEEAPPPKSQFSLVPVLPIVLHTGSRPWGSARSLRELSGPPQVFQAFVPDWQPIFWEVASHSLETLTDGKSFFLQAMMLFKADDAELADAEKLYASVFRSIDSLHETSRVRWLDLVQFLLGWAHNRRPNAERDFWKATALELQSDAERRKEIDSMSTTIAQSIYQEGRQEGRQEGLVEGARTLLLRFGRKKLGDPSPAMMATVNSLNDLNRIERLSEQLDDVHSWEDLFRSP